MIDLIKVKDLVILIAICAFLAYADVEINQRMGLPGLADGQRYFDSIINGKSALAFMQPLVSTMPEWAFVFSMTFTIYFAFGLVFLSSKDWLMTLLALLGFSVTLLAGMNIYAQGMLMVAMLIFWKSKPKTDISSCSLNFPYELAHSLTNTVLPWALFGIACLLLHQYGSILFLVVLGSILLSKFSDGRLDINLGKFKYLAYAGFLAVLATGYFGIMQGTNRLTLFYPTILPGDFGLLNTFIWLTTLELPLFITFIKSTDENMKREVILVALIFFAACANFVWHSQLEVDFFRILAIGDLIMLYAIAEARARKPNEWNASIPLVLLLFGIERIVLGMRLL